MLSTPTPLDDLKECKEHPWEIEYNEESNEYDYLYISFFPFILFFFFLFFYLLFLFIYFIFLLIFNIVFINSEIEFIKPLDDVKIQGRTITFTKDYKRTVFINNIINSGIMRMFISFFLLFLYLYSILIGKCYVFAQIIMVILV
jgi:hypothetical protein